MHCVEFVTVTCHCPFHPVGFMLNRVMYCPVVNPCGVKNVSVPVVPTAVPLLIEGNVIVGAAVSGIVMVVVPVTVAVNVAFHPVDTNPVKVTNAPVARLCADANVIVPNVNAVLISALLTAGNVNCVTGYLPFQPEGVKPDACTIAPLNKSVGLAKNKNVPTLPEIVALTTDVSAVCPPVYGPANVVPSQL